MGSGKFDGYWEMREGGPYDDGTKVFRCTDCGEVTETEQGWNGEPRPDKCKKGCHNREKATSDWNPGRVSKKFTDNYPAIFGHD